MNIRNVVLFGLLLVLVGCTSTPKSTQKDPMQANIVIKNGVPSHYQVQSGDTVTKIAKRYNLHWREISAMNHLDSSHTIYIGQWLMLWQPAKQEEKTSKAPNTPKKEGVGQVITERVFAPIQNISTPKSTNIPNEASEKPKVETTANEQTTAKFKEPKGIKADNQENSKAQISNQKEDKEMVETGKLVEELPATIKTDYGTLPLLTPMGKTPLLNMLATGQFRYPVGTQNKVVRAFGSLVNGVSSEGMFFAGQDGDVIVASQSGVVVYADDNQKQGDPKAVMIEHDDGYVSTYIHLKDISVKKGQKVAMGAKVGSMQQQTTNLALFEFRMAKDGHYIDPVLVLK